MCCCALGHAPPQSSAKHPGLVENTAVHDQRQAGHGHLGTDELCCRRRKGLYFTDVRNTRARLEILPWQ